jgi:hypothetical protein
VNGLVHLPARCGYIRCRDEQFDLLDATVVGLSLHERFLDQAIGIIDPPEFEQRFGFAPNRNVLKTRLLVFRGDAEREVKVPSPAWRNSVADMRSSMDTGPGLC